MSPIRTGKAKVVARVERSTHSSTPHIPPRPSTQTITPPRPPGLRIVPDVHEPYSPRHLGTTDQPPRAAHAADVEVLAGGAGERQEGGESRFAWGWKVADSVRRVTRK